MKKYHWFYTSLFYRPGAVQQMYCAGLGCFAAVFTLAGCSQQGIFPCKDLQKINKPIKNLSILA